MASIIFWVALASNIVLLIGLISSTITGSNSQFWPPPSKDSWQYHLLWWAVRLIVASIVALATLSWGQMDLPNHIRYLIGLPIFTVSFLLGSMAGLDLGWSNTHGIEDGFIDKGFYRYSRNPQYVLFSISFIAGSVVIASPKALVLLWLLACWYLIAPLPEERWLEAKYGERYLNYKKRVPRYFYFL